MRFYVSHSIRGAKGEIATFADMKANCDRIIKMANEIRQALPSVELYVPAEHEFPPVGYFLREGYVTVEQVLKIDLMIIDECDGVIVFSPPDDMMCGGRTVEFEHAVATSKPVMVFEHVEAAIEWLAHQLLRA